MLIKSIFTLFQRTFLPLLVLFISVAIIYFITLAAPKLLNDKENLASLQQLFSILQSALTITAIVIGGIWTYYRFIKGRTLVRKVEPKLSSYHFKVDEHSILSIEASIKNIGNVRVTFSQAYLIIGSATPDRPRGPELDFLAPEQKIDILSYFRDKKVRYMLEPNEDMRRTVIIGLPITTHPLTRIDLIVESERNRCWSTTTVISTLKQDC